jgi:hypothetical protein
MKFLEHGYFNFIGAIFQVEEEHGDTLGLSINKGVLHLWELFACLPIQALHALLEGNLCRKFFLRDKVIHETFEPKSAWSIRTYDKAAPAVYLRALVDREGQNPTTREFIVAVNALRRYAASQDLETANRIDNAYFCVSERSHHYLEGVKLRVQTLVTCCEAISGMCEEVDPQQHDQPAPFAVTYCGYAEQVDRRKKQYEKKQSTT